MNDAPIVLVHGIFGFNQLTLNGAKIADYFRDIPQALRESGHVVPEPPQLPQAGSVLDRAKELKTYLENNAEVAGKKVHLIAHSMGGLDSRQMISTLNMADRVLSLTTIGTPHHGSPIANIVDGVTNPGLPQIVELLGGNIAGVHDLTTPVREQFNQEVFEAPNVRYFSIAGQFKAERFLFFFRKPLGSLELTQRILTSIEGDNDGLVSVKSAAFGQDPRRWTFLETWEANHFRLVNWGRDILPTPAELADQTIVNKYKALVARIKQSVTE